MLYLSSLILWYNTSNMGAEDRPKQHSDSRVRSEGVEELRFDEESELDEEMLKILAEPTKAEKRYQELVTAGAIEEVDWNDPESVSEYCRIMYRIRRDIYGDACPLPPFPDD